MQKNDLGLLGKGDMKEIILLNGYPKIFLGPFETPKLDTSEALAKLVKVFEIVFPGKRSATPNPGFSGSYGFRLSPE